MLSKPLLDRITSWVAVSPRLTRLLLHPDDRKEWEALYETEEYKSVAGRLPVKFLGEREVIPAGSNPSRSVEPNGPVSV